MNIISFCLWGNDPKYTIGAIRNAERAKQIYPGWDVWMYIADDVPDNTIKELEHNDCVIINMGEGNWKGMFWRFLPGCDPNITFISRDTDSRLSMREKYAVDEWIASDKDFHIMRDHPYHKTEILGGMWGARNGIVKDIDTWMNEYEKGDFWQVDQNFLREVVYPKVKDNCIVHDPFFDNKPFPGPNGKIWDNNNFVGCAFDEYDRVIL
jgi:protein O-GlcNAc transferase